MFVIGIILLVVFCNTPKTPENRGQVTESHKTGAMKRRESDSIPKHSAN
jgi:hypothetical protein